MKLRVGISFSALSLLLVSLSPGAGGSASAETGGEPPAPRLLRVRWVGTHAESHAERLRDSWRLRWLLEQSPGWKVEVVTGLERSPGAAGSPAVSVVAGELPLPAEARPLTAGLPVDLGDGKTPRVRLAGTEYTVSEVAAVFHLLAGADADWLVTGGDPRVVESAVVRLLRTVIRPRGRHPAAEADFDFRIAGGELERRGRWRRVETGGGVAYGVDPASDQDDFAERRRWYAELARIPRQRVVLRVPAGQEGLQRWVGLADELDHVVSAMAPKVPVTLSKAMEVVVEDAGGEAYVRLGRYTGELRPAVLPRHGLADVHAVLQPDDRFALFQALGRALVRRALLHRGPAPSLPPWIERGAGLWLSGDWYGRPWREWLPRLAAADVLPTPEELDAPDLGRAVAETLFTPVAAAVVDRLPGATLADKLAELDLPALRAALSAVEAAARKVTVPAPTRVAARPRLPAFLAGVSFAMAPGIATGYQAPRALEQLDRVHESLGANAVSLMPMASQRDPSRPEMAFLNQGTGSETDLALVAGARAARERGLAVLWKPHLYVGGGWSGDVEMTTEADWQTWWRFFRRYIVHHAFLATYARADLFSVGVELGKTLDREADWRHLIGAVRLFYRGPLTYSGNWWGDADRAGFWDELDYLGIDAYYPLADATQATDPQLAAGARDVVRRLQELARLHGRPVLLTEVGFAARKGAWVSPHQEGGELDESDQARAYRMLLGALGRPSWLAGVFVWKVFSADRRETRSSFPDFRFLGRPAEEVVRRYFARQQPMREEPRPSTR